MILEHKVIVHDMLSAYRILKVRYGVETGYPKLTRIYRRISKHSLSAIRSSMLEFLKPTTTRVNGFYLSTKQLIDLDDMAMNRAFVIYSLDRYIFEVPKIGGQSIIIYNKTKKTDSLWPWAFDKHGHLGYHGDMGYRALLIPVYRGDLEFDEFSKLYKRRTHY